MKIKNIIIATLLTLFAFSCSSPKPTPAERLTEMSEYLDKSDTKYSEEEWEVLGLEIEEIEDEIQKNKDKYSAEELAEINRLKGKCLAKMAKKAVNDFAGEFGNFLQESESILGGFMEEINKGKESEE
ncbi:MAG: hypothetical protein MJZ00_07360 [Paludibacteraceae bacterium]|nr:hypothetical protein [Paludibacteraceae bacterium]